MRSCYSDARNVRQNIISLWLSANPSKDQSDEKGPPRSNRRVKSLDLADSGSSSRNDRRLHRDLTFLSEIRLKTSERDDDIERLVKTEEKRNLTSFIHPDEDELSLLVATNHQSRSRGSQLESLTSRVNTWPGASNLEKSREITVLINTVRRLCEMEQDAIAVQISTQQDRRKVAAARKKIQKWDSEIMKLHRQALAGEEFDFPSFAKYYKKAEDSRNRLGPLEDKLDRKELELERLQNDIVDIYDNIEDKLHDFEHVEYEDVDINDDDSSLPPSRSSSSMGDSSILDIRNVPIFDASELGSERPDNGDERVMLARRGIPDVTEDWPEIPTFEIQAPTAIESQDQDLVKTPVGMGTPRATQNIDNEIVEEIPALPIPLAHPVPQRRQPIELKWLETPPEMMLSRVGHDRISGITDTSNTEIESIGSWGGDKNAQFQEDFPSPTSSTTLVSGRMEEVRIAMKRQSDPLDMVNNWLLTTLVSSVLQWGVWESILETQVPHKTELPENLFKEDFINLWALDEKLSGQYRTPLRSPKDFKFSWIPRSLPPPDLQLHDEPEIWYHDSSSHVSIM